MKVRSYPRAIVSFALVLAVTTLFTLRSFAALDARKASPEPTTAQDCTGTLTVKSGQITINGNVAQTGATVMSGSVITTGSKSSAIIDLGPLGRIEIGGDTSITVTCTAGSLQIRTSCAKAEIDVRRGTLDVRAPQTETLSAGKKAKFDGAIDATAAGGVDVKIDCGTSKGGGGKFISPGLLGLLALIGVGGAVALGVNAGSNGNERAAGSSPIR